MKKRLYYTIEKSTYVYDSFSLDGNKTISIYSIDDNDPSLITDIECQLEDNSKKKIQEWLNDNGYGDDEFDIIQL